MAREAAGGVGGVEKVEQLGGLALRGQQPPLASLKSHTAADQTRSASDDAVVASLDDERARYEERAAVDGADAETECCLIHVGHD